MPTLVDPRVVEIDNFADLGIDIVQPQKEKGRQEGLLAYHSEPPLFPSGVVVVDSFCKPRTADILFIFF